MSSSVSTISNACDFVHGTDGETHTGSSTQTRCLATDGHIFIVPTEDPWGDGEVHGEDGFDGEADGGELRGDLAAQLRVERGAIDHISAVLHLKAEKASGRTSSVSARDA